MWKKERKLFNMFLALIIFLVLRNYYLKRAVMSLILWAFRGKINIFSFSLKCNLKIELDILKIEYNYVPS